MEDYVFQPDYARIILEILAWSIWGIFITSLWIYGALFAKRAWINDISWLMIAIGVIMGAYQLIFQTKELLEFIITIVFVVAGYYAAYRLALFYKKRNDKKSQGKKRI